MKQYIKDNLTPLAIGAIITFSFCKIEQYIWVLKGEKVDINVLKRAQPGIWYQFILSQELSKLQEAYFTALGFFGENINAL